MINLIIIPKCIFIWIYRSLCLIRTLITVMLLVMEIFRNTLQLGNCRTEENFWIIFSIYLNEIIRYVRKWFDEIMLWSIRYVNNILVLIPYCAYITRKNVVIWWRHHAIVRTNKVVHAGETPRWCNWKYNSNQSQNSTEQYSIFTFSTTTHPVKTRKQKRQKPPKKQKQNKNKTKTKKTKLNLMITLPLPLAEVRGKLITIMMIIIIDVMVPISIWM